MPANKKAANKKSVANKATKKAANKRVKKAEAAKVNDKKASAADSASKAAEKKVESIHQSRRRKEEGNNENSRKHSPAAFTIQDAREMMKKRQKEDLALQEEARKVSQNTKPTPNRTTANAIDESVPQQKSKHGAASLNDILGFNPTIPGAKPAGNSVPQKWKKYYDMLIELRDEVQEELKMHSSETLKRSQKEDSGDIVTSADAGTDNFDRDFALSLLSSEQEALKEIQSAIQRIYNGTFGVCEITGKPIAAERLEAVPFTRFSLEGRKQHEMSARRRVQRTGAFIHEGSADNLSFGDDDNDN
jgi:RNA polymerase-binding transcription factor DksA